ncbi:DUF3618 domain-containing protein [Streptomyces virginiae]|uniref:DUF3618 domain-containing protein n=1 Tax=Streptomyces virginiae TaxID=1961 RepID=UPI0038209A8F
MTSRPHDGPVPRQPATRQPTADEPSPEELRARIEHTRDQLGRTVEALAAKADVKAQATEKAAHVTGQIRDRVQHVAHLAAEKTPDPVLDKAGRAALLTVGAALIVFLLVRGNRRRNR